MIVSLPACLKVAFELMLCLLREPLLMPIRERPWGSEILEKRLGFLCLIEALSHQTLAVYHFHPATIRQPSQPRIISQGQIHLPSIICHLSPYRHSMCFLLLYEILRHICTHEV